MYGDSPLVTFEADGDTVTIRDELEGLEQVVASDRSDPQPALPDLFPVLGRRPCLDDGVVAAHQGVLRLGPARRSGRVPGRILDSADRRRSRNFWRTTRESSNSMANSFTVLRTCQRRTPGNSCDGPWTPNESERNGVRTRVHAPAPTTSRVAASSRPAVPSVEPATGDTLLSAMQYFTPWKISSSDG